jgi:hypothetical protein
LAASFLAAADAAQAQAVDPKLWVTNGVVQTITEHDGRLYIGGGFTRVSPATGGGVAADNAGGVPLPQPQVVGEVLAVLADSTGWYIGGSFTSVGGLPRENLAHINDDGTVSAWNPGANGAVRALAGSGATLYIGGDFTSAGTTHGTRNHIAGIKKSNGALTSWNPGTDGSVYALAVIDTVIYAGGQFTTIGGASRSNAGAVSTAGNVRPWAPNPNGPVYAVTSGGDVMMFMGGFFTSVAGGAALNVTAVDLTTGTGSTPFNTNGPVYALAYSTPNLYVGGSFSSFAGGSRVYLGGVDVSNGNLLPLNPTLNGAVYSVILSGNLYVGGAFTTVNGTPRSYAASISTNSVLLGWDPSPNDFVHALSRGFGLRNGFTFVGGDFTGVGGVARKNIAAIDPSTGIPTAWNPIADDLVATIAVVDTTVYAGGFFSNIGGQPRKKLASLSALTGNASPGWAPNPDSSVYALAVDASSVYVGGEFLHIGGQNLRNLAKLSRLSGAPILSWNPNPDGLVFTMALSDPFLYVGGVFSQFGTSTRTNIARVVSQTGALDGWAPNANAGLATLAVSGTTIYAGGIFTAIGGQPRARIAALRADSALALAWNPGADTTVYVIKVNGGKVYAGGLFQYLGGQPRNFVGCLNPTTGAPMNWDTQASNAVTGIAFAGPEAYLVGHFKSVLGTPHSKLAGVTVQPSITSVTPSTGGNVGLATLTIHGGDFQSGATARLSGFGSVILGTGVSVAADGASLTATFDMNGAQAGARSVIVVNPDSQRDSLINGFTVTALAAPQLRVNIVGPPVIRAAHRTAFDFVVENRGNVDAVAVPLWIAGIPLDAAIEVDSTVASPPQDPGEPNWGQVPLTFTGSTGQYLVLVLPRVPPGTVSRRIYLTVPASDPTFSLVAAVMPTWEESPSFDSCLRDGGIVAAAPCAGGHLGLMNAYAANTPGVYALSGTRVWAKIGYQCEAATTLPAAIVQSQQALNFMLQSVTPPSTQPPSCSAALAPRWRSVLLVSVVTSIDPNEKVGATGSVALQQAIPYSVRFENLAQATAPAQQVVISDPLDVTLVDPATVSLDAITFGSIRIVPPPGLRSYATQVDLRPGKNLLVNVSAAVDLFTGVLSWYFSSIDPATGQPPQSPLVGFLPPNHVPPEGEGSVLFTVLPRGTVSSGTTIKNHAAIAFDGSAPLMTAEWSNVVDGTPPASAVLPLPANQDSLRFTVRWASQGGPSDLRDYTIYVSEDTGPYHAWRLNTVATADTFAAHGGHTYKYYSVARDANGNVEGAPASPDAQTFSSVAVGDPRVAWTLGLAGAVPNPARGQVWASIVLANAAPATLELMDVAGRRVFRREVGALGAGPHVVPIAAQPTLRAGLYFLRLSQGPQVLHARVALIR